MSREGRKLWLYDSILDSDIILHPPHLQVFIWLLATAKREQRPVGKGRTIRMPNGERKMEAGQVTFTVRDLASKLKRTKSSIQRSVEYLKKRDTITYESGTLFGFATLVNWPDCQPEWADSGTPSGTLTGTEAGQRRDILRESENLRRGESSPPPPIPRNRAEASDDRRDRALALIGKCQGHAERLRGSKLIDFDAPPQMSHLQTLRTDVEIEETFEFFLKSRRKQETATFRNFFRFFEEIENELVEAEITEGRSSGQPGAKTPSTQEEGRGNGNGSH